MTDELDAAADYFEITIRQEMLAAVNINLSRIS